jgi:hypothetical protein
VRQAIESGVAQAIQSLGLEHGPIHAECRVNDRGVYVLEVAARPIGGLCARALRVIDSQSREIGLEELILRHALGESPTQWVKTADATGVMMIPIPGEGIYRGVDGIESARQVNGVEDVRITAKLDQRLVPLPEGASYLGFIFARASDPDGVEKSLREAHRRLRFTIDRAIAVNDLLPSAEEIPAD